MRGDAKPETILPSMDTVLRILVQPESINGPYRVRQMYEYHFGLWPSNFPSTGILDDKKIFVSKMKDKDASEYKTPESKKQTEEFYEDCLLVLCANSALKNFSDTYLAVAYVSLAFYILAEHGDFSVMVDKAELVVTEYRQNQKQNTLTWLNMFNKIVEETPKKARPYTIAYINSSNAQKMFNRFVNILHVSDVANII